MQQRPRSIRQTSPLRKPWHVDYLHMRELARAVVAQDDFARDRLLDVGCGSRPYEPFLRHVSSYVGMDVHVANGLTDVSGLAYQLPFVANSFDSVLSTQTLEHVESPILAVTEIARVLRPGGYLILTAPQTWRLHEKPYDFYRYTRFGLAYLVEQADMEVISIDALGGVWTTVGQIVNNAVHQRLRPRLPVYMTYLIYLLNNAVFSQLDSVWVDHDETTNYLVLARKVLS